MTARIQTFPLGNADTLRLDLADDRKVLIDYAAMRDDDDDEDKRCNLPKELRRDLSKSGRDYYDAVCITHLDRDHCKGFGEFFWLEHAAIYQEDDRIKIKELWVPAAAILEENLKDDARIIRAEARHRLRMGKGIRVFSFPDRLKKWMDKEGLDYEDRKQLIVDAGQTVPGFSKDGPERTEFFVHCPFAWRQDENTMVVRNEDSVVMQVSFVEENSESKLFLASDVDHETLSAIVQTSRKHGNEDHLLWDVMKLPHHCSYLSLGPERGKNETSPTPDVKYLFEDMREERSYIVSPSLQIPEKDKDDDNDQPPHRQAANYHKRISTAYDGNFTVTMEHPLVSNPQPFAYKVTAFGVAFEVIAPMVSSSAAASTIRVG